jgi:hypothetical protein
LVAAVSVTRKILIAAPLGGAVLKEIVVALAKVYAVVRVPFKLTLTSVSSKYGKVKEYREREPFPV